MNSRFTICVLLVGLISGASALTLTEAISASGSHSDTAERSPYHRQDTWYEFILRQFNPEKINYGDWFEEERHHLVELRLSNPYFLYSICTSLAVILAAGVCLKQRIDHGLAMSITAEMMADLYNQDAYSRQIAQDAIERYNKHVERCNRAIEGVEGSLTRTGPDEIEQLRTELMRIAEERDNAIRDRDIAREELRRKSEILADMSARLEAATSKAGTATMARTTADLHGADARLVTHINNLQEQLYSERNNNRRLRGG